MNIAEFFPGASPEMLAELAEYYQDLQILSNEKISIQFNNKGKEHAVLVMGEIFRTAFNRVKIFARNFDGAISDNRFYQTMLKNYLQKSEENRVDVIFESEPNPQSKSLSILKEFRQNSPNRITLCKASESQLASFKGYLVNPERVVHFTLANDPVKGFNKYRCETDVNNYVAILNFDDPKFCSTLDKMFDILSKEATTII